jgi:hypothetical protein
MTRAALRERLERESVRTGGQALVHLLFGATLDGLLVRGPVVGGEHAFVLVEDCRGPRPKIDRHRALPELARRYLNGHGPADARDLAKWAGLSLHDARAGIAGVAHNLDQRPNGLVDLKDRRTPLAEWPAPRLLGPFDPRLLGWRSRDLVLDKPKEVITTSGIIKAILLVDGRAAGTWTMPGGRVQVHPWNKLDPQTWDAVAAESTAVRPTSASGRDPPEEWAT